MLCEIGTGELLSISTAIRLAGEVREIPDPTIRSEVLTRVQILLTGFIAGLEPLPGDRTASGTLRSVVKQTTRSDA
jgi:hypothetical protein